jgi:hypothetical protein
MKNTMQLIFLCSLFFPLTIWSAEHTLTIKNESDQTITVYYMRSTNIQWYKMLYPTDEELFDLKPPQDILIHFHKLDQQRLFSLAKQDRELIVKRFNDIEIVKKDPSSSWENKE